MTQNESTKPKVQKHKKLMLVRYGQMGYLGWFEHNENQIPKTEKRVVIKTDRGLELGELIGQFNYRAGHFKSTEKEVEDYFPNRTRDYPLGAGGTFVRFATSEDISEEKHLEASAEEEKKCCERFVKEMELPMKIISAEHLFGGERIIIYFSSNGRVDFRELVKKLAKEYQTRIELRQIGSRDEARIVSDYESCGQECCCRRFLKILDPVNMRMAKLQKATLDPSKISGHCGRLKCCLRYEDSTYRDLKKRMPKKNTIVKTPNGEGKVVDVQILTQLAVVLYDSGNREAWPIDEIDIIGRGNNSEQAENGQIEDEENDDIDIDDQLDDLADEESPEELSDELIDQETDRQTEHAAESENTEPAAESETTPSQPQNFVSKNNHNENPNKRTGRRRKNKRRQNNSNNRNQYNNNKNSN